MYHIAGEENLENFSLHEARLLSDLRARIRWQNGNDICDLNQGIRHFNSLHPHSGERVVSGE